MISRRDLLIRSAGAGSGDRSVFAAERRCRACGERAAAAAEPRADLPILVVVELTGGNDGLNTVVPYADDVYHKSRPTLRIEPDKVLKLDDRVGLHPAMKELHAALGFRRPGRDPRGRLSEPEPLALPLDGDLADGRGRARARRRAGWAGPPTAIPRSGLCHVGPQSVPLAVAGPQGGAPGAGQPGRLSARARRRPGRSGRRGRAGDPVLDQVRRQFAAARELSARLAAIPADRRAQDVSASPETLEGRLETIRRLIEADLPLPGLLHLPGRFDTHAGQRYTHQDLLRQVSQGVAGFLKSLKASRLDERVVVLLFSEFGRRLKENASSGTDHGAAAPVLLAGKPVKGGLIGPPPDLSNLDEGGDPRFTTDFRDVYATLLRRWLAIDPEPILGRREGRWHCSRRGDGAAVGRSRTFSHGRKTRLVLLPPKPNEFDTATRTRCGLASLATRQRSTSGSSRLIVGGIAWCRKAVRQASASKAPAAVSMWPVRLLVDETGIRSASSPRTSRRTAASAASPTGVLVAWALT